MNSLTRIQSNQTLIQTIVPGKDPPINIKTNCKLEKFEITQSTITLSISDYFVVIFCRTGHI